MNRNYADITSRILEEPSWWQEGGIPRYGQFEPGQSTGVYTHQVALEQSAHIPRVDEQIREGTIEYGDPKRSLLPRRPLDDVRAHSDPRILASRSS